MHNLLQNKAVMCIICQKDFMLMNLMRYCLDSNAKFCINYKTKKTAKEN